MTTVTIPITAFSAQSVAPDARYGQLAALPLFNAAANIYYRAPIASKIPAGATVVSAKVQFWGRSDETGGTRDIRTQPVAAPKWDSNVTWTTRPQNTAGSAVLVSKASPGVGTLWEWVVTADVQAVVSGTRVDYGWRLIADAANANTMKLAGSTADLNAPKMVVEYTIPPEAPENLHPSGGAVSVAKPTLTFDGDADMTGLQVQIDPAMSTTAPGFDSGTVASSGGLFNSASGVARTVASVTTTSASTTIGFPASAIVAADIGATITGTGIPAGATIATVPTSTTATISAAATATGTITATVTRTYAGLAAGSSTYWRARQQTAGGWSAWSDWVGFSRVAFPAASFVSPASGVIEDPTPPTEWTFAGTQTAYRARLVNSGGTVLSSSGYTPGTGNAWTPVKGFTKSGQSGELQVDIFDDEERVATAGDPEYTRITIAVTYTLDPTVDPMTTLVVTPAADGLGQLITGTRTPSGTPDEALLFRNGEIISTHVGTDVFTGTALDGITDPLPLLGQVSTYRVAPRVNGHTASGGPTVTVTPAATGIHLFDLENPDDRVLILTETGVPEQDEPEDAVVHRPLNKDAEGLGSVVRRRLVRYRKEGTVTGVLVGDPDGEALLRTWAEYDAGHLFGLAFSGYSGRAIVGEFKFPERDNPRQARVREVGVVFRYWGQA